MDRRYILVLVDRATSAQITAAFGEINSIDQATEGLVRNLKKWNEEHPEKKALDTEQTVEEAVKKYVG